MMCDNFEFWAQLKQTMSAVQEELDRAKQDVKQQLLEAIKATVIERQSYLPIFQYKMQCSL